MVLAGCFGAMVFFAVTAGGSNVRKFKPVFPAPVEIARFAGLGLDQVALVGNKNTSDTAIFSALGLEQSPTFFSLSISEARKRIETLPWVKSVAISRAFPSQLNIRITERTPVAVWETGDGREIPSFIDATGRVLGAVAMGENRQGLMRLLGKGAPADSRNLMALLNRHATLRKFVRVAERVGVRRWSLHLATGSIVHLPAEGVDAALRRPKVQQVLNELGRYSNVTIDLRTPGRITVRRQPLHKSAGAHHVL